MVDLLAHVCLAYAVGRLASLRLDWLNAHYVTVVLVGAVIPDLIKIHLLVDAGIISRLFGVPFSWQPLQTVGGVTVCVFVGGLLVSRRQRSRALVLLALGAATHLIADWLLLSPSGRSFAVFWPISRVHPPTPGLYLSTDLVPTVVAVSFAGIVWLVTHSHSEPSS